MKRKKQIKHRIEQRMADKKHARQRKHFLWREKAKRERASIGVVQTQNKGS